MTALAVRAVFALLVLGGTAVAQDRSDPSDLELGAAYCLAFKNEMRNWALATWPKSADPEIGKIFQKWKAEADDEIGRLKAYLLAHGILTADKAPGPFLLASRRGTHDAQECSAAVDNNANACDQKCSQSCSMDSIGPDACLACQKTCDPIPACQRGSKCNAVESSLPF